MIQIIIIVIIIAHIIIILIEILINHFVLEVKNVQNLIIKKFLKKTNV